MQATAVAHPNIALVKYWGKRDPALNLPAVGSISLTLKHLRTRTRVVFDPALKRDELQLDGRPADGHELERVARFLDRVRQRAERRDFARVESDNDFPTAAGLASSASGFAALGLAATAAAGLSLSGDELAVLCRLGSGSAPRSLHGGFVEMARGERPDGQDAVPRQLLGESAWPLKLLVAVTTEAKKAVSSTAGMQAHSPYREAWVREQPADLQALRGAIERRDFAALGEISERSCLKMHGVMLAAGLVYFAPATLEVMAAVHELRRGGTAAYFTIDAGPQVKVLCQPADAARVERLLGEIVPRVLVEEPGPGAALQP